MANSVNKKSIYLLICTIQDDRSDNGYHELIRGYVSDPKKMPDILEQMRTEAPTQKVDRPDGWAVDCPCDWFFRSVEYLDHISIIHNDGPVAHS